MFHVSEQPIQTLFWTIASAIDEIVSAKRMSSSGISLEGCFIQYRPYHGMPRMSDPQTRGGKPRFGLRVKQ